MNLNDIFVLEEKFMNQLFEGDESFHIIKGNVPIILSSPHSTTHYRLNKDKIGEYRTGCVVDYLSKKLDCHGIYKTKHNFDDPNWDESTPYKENLIKYVKENDIKYLIDLHMMSPKREYLIEIGTGRGKNVFESEIIDDMKSIFLKNSLQPLEIDKLFSANNPNTISASIARECQISCIQIEVNWIAYDVEKNGECLLKKCMASFDEIILSLKKRIND